VSEVQEQKLNEHHIFSEQNDPSSVSILQVDDVDVHDKYTNTVRSWLAVCWFWADVCIDWQLFLGNKMIDTYPHQEK
jgi:hypothetical protein